MVPWYLYPLLLPLLGVVAPSATNPNLALHKPTEMSSTSVDPNRCADGDLTSANHECCATTGSDVWNWWMVDLGKSVTIKSVRVTTGPCCSYYMSNFTVEVSATNPKFEAGFPGLVQTGDVCLVQYELPPNRMPVVYNCQQPTTGRYLRVVHYNPLRYKKLSFAEIEAFGYYQANYTVGDYPAAINNIALNKPASQSSGAAGWKVVDGDLDPRTLGLFTTANGQQPHWWMVDLEKIYVIDTLRAVNRGGGLQLHFQHFTIEVSKENPSSFAGFPGFTTQASKCLTQIDHIHFGFPITLKCDKPVVGRYVRVVKNEWQALGMAELEIFEVKPVNRFIHMGGSHSGTKSENSPAARRHMTSCARKFIKSVATIQFYDFSVRYFHVDLEDGKCRYMENYQDHTGIASSSWVAFKYE